MKKSVLALGTTIILALSGYSQAYEGTAEYDKKKQAAILIDYSYTTAAVEAAVVQKMASLGYKVKEEKGLFNKDKGFMIYKAAIIPDISSNTMDYYINVERKSRKEKDESTLSMIINQNGTNILDSGSEAASKAKEFLNNMIPDVEAANLELQITDQQETISKSEKKLRNLQDDQQDLEKKLQNNQRDQETTQKAIETQKAALDALKAKRKSNRT